MARGFSVSVGIGAKLSPTFNSIVSGVERRFGLMNRKLRVQAAETKLAVKEIGAAFKPIGAMMAAGGLTAGLHGIFGEGNEYAHQISMLRLAGRTTTEVSKAIAAANRTMREVPTSTLVENLAVLKETTLAYGNFGHAIENLSFNQRMGGMFKLAFGDKFGDEGTVFNQLIRAMEIRGSALDPKRYQSEASGLFRAMMATGGVVNPEQILGFVQQANPAVRGYSQEFFTGIIPALIQEFGGERAGTALTAFNNQILGRVGVGGKLITQEWQRLGLVPPNGTAGNLSQSGWSPGALKGTALARSNPLAFVEQVLLPAMSAHGIDINNSNAVGLEAKKLFGRETAARIASTLLDPIQRVRLHNNQALFNRAMGPDQAYGQAMRNDPRMAMAASAASLKNLETTLGKAVTPTVISGLQNMAKAVNWLAGAFDRHPLFAKGTVALLGFGAASTTMMAFGVAAKYALMPLRLLLMPLRLLGTAFMRAFGPAIVRSILSIGPRLLTLAPVIAEGLAGAFALVSNPLGWTALAVLAGSAALALVVTFKTQIGAFLSRAWGAIKGAFLSLPWRSIGIAVANSMTFGLASGLPAAIGWLKGKFGGNAQPKTFRFDRAGSTPPLLAGKRASGGPVVGGRLYLVGERGPELFRAPSDGSIISASNTAAMGRRRAPTFAQRDRRGRPATGGGVHMRDIHIHGVTDPEAVGRVVRREIHKMAASQDGNFSD